MLKTLLKLSTPLIVGQLAYILLSFVDNMMIGRVDTNSLAAAAFVNGIFSLFAVFSLGFTIGLLPIISKLHADSKEEEAGATLKNSIFLNALFSFVVIVISIIIYENLSLFDLDKGLLELVKPYFRTQIYSYFFMVLYLGFKQYFDGIGRTIFGMIAIWLSIIVNIILNYVLIFGHLGFDAMGLYGAGIATLISRIVCTIILILVFLGNKDFIIAKRSFLNAKIRISKQIDLFRLSLPISIQMGVESASFTIVTLFVVKLGSTALASHNVATSISMLGFMIFYGIGSATTVLVARYSKQKRYSDMNKALKLSMLFTLSIVLILMIIFYFTRHDIAYIFTNDSNVVHMVSFVMISLILYQIGDATQIIYVGALRGIEDVRFLAWISALLHIIVNPSLAYILAFKIGIEGSEYQLMSLWMAYPISLSILGTILFFRFRYISKRLK